MTWARAQGGRLGQGPPEADRVAATSVTVRAMSTYVSFGNSADPTLSSHLPGGGRESALEVHPPCCAVLKKHVEKEYVYLLGYVRYNVFFLNLLSSLVLQRLAARRGSRFWLMCSPGQPWALSRAAHRARHGRRLCRRSAGGTPSLVLRSPHFFDV